MKQALLTLWSALRDSARLIGKFLLLIFLPLGILVLIWSNASSSYYDDPDNDRVSVRHVTPSAPRSNTRSRSNPPTPIIIPSTPGRSRRPHGRGGYRSGGPGGGK